MSFLRQINDSLFEYDIQALVEPVYLGFGALAHFADFRDKAYRYFKEAKEKHNAKYLTDNFDDNAFYHPRALMLFLKNTPIGIASRLRFCENCFSSDAIEKALSSTAVYGMTNYK